MTPPLGSQRYGLNYPQPTILGEPDRDGRT